jgi:hypothetical protein
MFDAGSFDMLGMGGWAGSQPTPPKRPPPTILLDPDPEVTVSPGVPLLNVNDAWHLFGFPKKRATRDEVKSRYLSLIVKYHPDRHIAHEKQATEYTIKINAAWTLLQRHCKW